jgi:predicted TIM-barrel fold metal-dependent hydrolase
VKSDTAIKRSNANEPLREGLMKRNRAGIDWLINILKLSLFAGLLAVGVAACGFKGKQVARKQATFLPLFDVHFHYSEPVGEDELFSDLSAAHITRSVLFGTEAAADMAGEYPRRFVASYSGRLSTIRRELKGGRDETIAEEIAGDFEQALRSGRYRGLGEVSTYHHAYPDDPIAPDSPLILRLLEVAGRYHVPINIHCSDFGYPAMERALRAYPNTTVIWAHTGSHLPPDKIRALLWAYPNLYFDLAAMDQTWPQKHTLLSFFGRIDGSWRNLFEEFPDRFLVGFDLSTNADRIRQISQAATDAVVMQRVLLGLTSATATKLAYQNAERLYQVK